MATKASFTGGPGTSVGRYEIITKLFESELGTLSAARVGSGDDSGKTVAVRLIDAGEEALEALGALARRVKKLGNELVVPVIDTIEGDKKLAVVSDYVEGEALGTLLRVASVRRAALPVPVALRLTLDLLDAVQFVHGQAEEVGDDASRLFGGLTPGGVLVGSDGRARIMEIGLSGYSARVEPWCKDPKRVAYLAPEALKKDEALGAQADVFTVGVLLWEMLQNKRLFGGLSFSAVSAKVLEQKITPADAGRVPGAAPLSSALTEVVAKALERDPASRYATAADMAAAIRAAGDAIATLEQAAELVEQLAGRTITGYRNSIAKGPLTKAAAPATVSAAPPAPTAEPAATPADEDAGRKSPLPKKEPPRATDDEPEPAGEDEAKVDKKLPPPTRGGAAASPPKPAPKKPALPVRAGADTEDEVSVDEASESGLHDAVKPAASDDAKSAADGSAEPKPATLEEGDADDAKAKPAATADDADDKAEAKPSDEVGEKADDKASPPPPKALDKAAEAVADEPLSDAAVLAAEDEIEVPGEPKRKGFMLAIVGVVIVVAIIVVAASQLGGPATPEPSAKPSAAPATTAAATTAAATVSAAPATSSEPAPSTSATETAAATAQPPPEQPTATETPKAGAGKLPVGGPKPPGTAKPKATSTKKYMPPDL